MSLLLAFLFWAVVFLLVAAVRDNAVLRRKIKELEIINRRER